MIEFVPLDIYYKVYLYSALAIVLITLFHAYVLNLNESKNIRYITFVGYFILIILTIYIGLRPVSGRYFIDMATYARIYEGYAHGGEIILKTDIIFQKFMKFCSGFIPTHSFFLLCASIYIIPMYIISKNLFKEFWFYAFFMFIASMSFWSSATNGVRNGMATSLFLLGISYFYKDKKIIASIIFIIATVFHQTIYLPLGAFIITLFVKQPKYFFGAWLFAIPLSIALGSFWENLFAGLGFADERLSGYLIGEKDAAFVNNSGFRYDFLFYSSFPVIIGAYFIFKKKYYDIIYNQLLNIYLIANAFWILVIRANFSNRFAYLSWFLMPFIIIYPFIKNNSIKKQHKIIGLVLLFYYAFTYFMYWYFTLKNLKQYEPQPL